MMQRGEPFGGPIITVDVESIDDALGRVAAAGGKVVLPKNEVPGMGFTAYFSDSEGNLMGLWQSAPPSEA
jgi:predicted enzyme related to lactoylglutathione lyase